MQTTGDAQITRQAQLVPQIGKDGVMMTYVEPTHFLFLSFGWLIPSLHQSWLKIHEKFRVRPVSESWTRAFFVPASSSWKTLGFD